MPSPIALTFEVIEEPTAEVEGHVRINGVDHHVTLIPVDGHGRDQRQLGDNNERYQALQEFEDCQPGFRSIRLGGRMYLCVITPFRD